MFVLIAMVLFVLVVVMASRQEETPNPHQLNLFKLEADRRWAKQEHDFLNVFRHVETGVLLHDFEEDDGYVLYLLSPMACFEEHYEYGILNLEGLELVCHRMRRGVEALKNVR